MCRSLLNEVKVGCWVYFDWAGYSSGLPHVIRSDSQLYPFSYAKVVGIDNTVFEVLTASGQRAEIAYQSVIRVLPSPKAIIGEEVIIQSGSSAGKLAVVDSMIWHHKDEEYKYNVVVGGKKKSRRYTDQDLCLPG